MVQSASPSWQVTGTTVYFLADPVCHQLPERCLNINKLPMPVCARCFAIYLGGFIIFVLAWIRQPQVQWPKWIYFITVCFFFIEVTGEHLNLYHNLFPLRLLSGFVLGVIIFRIILETIVNEKVQLKNG